MDKTKNTIVMVDIDLRVGNFISTGLNNVFKVQSIFSYGVVGNFLNGKPGDYTFDYLKPIPIDKEWLAKFGWHWNEETTSFEKLGFPMGHLRITPFGWTMFNYVLNSVTTNKDFHFIHELQNLFFALNQTELILEP